MDNVTFADQLLTKRLYETAYSKSKINVSGPHSAKRPDLIPTKVDNLNFQSKAMPKIRREKTLNKLYRAPPTPPPDKLMNLERSFTLDCIAVSNISDDYSTVNPKMGSAIPPYDSQNDKHVQNYFKFHGLNELLKRTNQADHHESIPGRLHDRFASGGPTRIYLDLRNQKFGNGHYPETFEGHRRFQGDNIRAIFSYNNNFGYRRNMPSLRKQPSTFLTDVKWLVHLKNDFKNVYTQSEIQRHFEQSYTIGNPYYDVDETGQTDFRDFHPPVRYMVTVKLGDNSLDQFKGNLFINVVSRTYDTGFVRLDKSNLVVSEDKKEVAKSCSSLSAIMSTPKTVEDVKTLERVRLFEKGKFYSFLFEERDVRTVQGIILSHDGRAGQSVQIDHVLLEVHKSTDRKVFRFPIEGWLTYGAQDKKTSNIKSKFGLNNSVVIYPNEKPKFEYSIVTAPQLFSESEYKIQLQCNVQDPKAPIDYLIRFHGTELPIGGRVVMKLVGNYEETALFKLSSQKGVVKIKQKDVGEVKGIYLKYDKKAQTLNDWFIEKIDVTRASSDSCSFDVNEVIKTMHEKTYTDRLALSNDSAQEHAPRPAFSGTLRVKIHGDKCSTNYINLKDAELDQDKVTFSFQHNAINVGNVKQVSLKYLALNNDAALQIKNIKVTNARGTFEREVDLELKNEDETQVPGSFEVDDLPKSKSSPKLSVKLIGEDNQTDYFALEDPKQADNGDLFTKNMEDIGVVKSIYVKYHGGDGSQVLLTSIDVVDPLGNSFKFAVDSEFKSGEVHRFNDPIVTLREVEKEEEMPKVETINEQPKRSNVKTNIKKIEAIAKLTPPKKGTTLYRLVVDTGDDVNNADYSNVYIQLVGDKQSSNEVNLFDIRSNKSNSDFQPNSVEKFDLYTNNLGKIRNVSVRVNRDTNINWHLNSITVIAPKSERYSFPVDGLFSGGDEDDNVNEIVLLPNERPDIFIKKSLKTPDSNFNDRDEQ